MTCPGSILAATFLAMLTAANAQEAHLLSYKRCSLRAGIRAITGHAGRDYVKGVLVTSHHLPIQGGGSFTRQEPGRFAQGSLFELRLRSATFTASVREASHGLFSVRECCAKGTSFTSKSEIHGLFLRNNAVFILPFYP
jgi:hypothetical protein